MTFRQYNYYFLGKNHWAFRKLDQIKALTDQSFDLTGLEDELIMSNGDIVNVAASDFVEYGESISLVSGWIFKTGEITVTTLHIEVENLYPLI